MNSKLFTYTGVYVIQHVRIIILLLPGEAGGVGAAHDRRDDVCGAKLRNGRDLFDDVVAEKHSTIRHERARVTSVDGDRFRRIDEHARHVVLISGRVAALHARRVRQHVKLTHVEAVLITVRTVDDHVRLDARVIKRRDDLKATQEHFLDTPATNTHAHTTEYCYLPSTRRNR